MERTYEIVTKHPDGFGDGVHTVTVKDSRSSDGRYVSGKGVGCSRDCSTNSDRTAIERLMAEHGMRVVSINRIKG